MKSLRLIALTLAVALPAAAQDAPPPGQDPAPVPADFREGRIDLWGGVTDLDSDSSKFEEYRDVPDGVTAPFFKLTGRRNRMTYDVGGATIRKNDMRYWANLGWEKVKINAELNKFPHRYGNDARFLYSGQGTGTFTLVPGVQQNLATAVARQFATNKAGVTATFLGNLVNGSLGDANVIDLGLFRQRSKVDVNITPHKEVQVRLSYFHEKREGDRGAGTAFGFGNVIETPEPLNYTTQDLGAFATLDRQWGSVRGSVRYNTFRNEFAFLTFQNPFRLTDSTHDSAYQAPGATTIDGPVLGRVSLPPDNESITGSVGGTFKLPGKTRFTADVTLSQWTQNSTPFIPYTTNTAVKGESFTGAHIDATNAASLPAPKLDGKVDVLNLAATVVSRPVKDLTLTARYRSYDFDNKTPRLEFPGYTRFDAVWEEIPRISVPYGFTQHRFDGTVGYDLGKATLEAGYRFTGFHRTFRETEKTADNAFTLAAYVRPTDRVMFRGSYEKGSRDFEHLDIIESEEASFLEAGAPANVLADSRVCPTGVVCNLRYEQAKRDSDRFQGLLELTPVDKVTLSVSYLISKDEYPDTRFGLVTADYDSFGADVDFTPSERWSVFGFYGRETNKNFQRGRQSGATVSVNPNDDWISDVKDVVDSFGGGLNISIVPDRWKLSLTGRHQNVDGNNAISLVRGGAAASSTRLSALGLPATGTAGEVLPGGTIEAFDDTTLMTYTAELTYMLKKSWSFAVGGWYEKYDIDDEFTTPLPNFLPATVFLNGLDGDYKATVGYVKVGYRW